jgi:hypothetical protein
MSMACDRAGVAQMVGHLAAHRALSKEVVEGAREHTGGMPLFVEEVTRLLFERGEAGGLQATPPTLQPSLAAGLDRLGPAREVAQIGAVLGRDFTMRCYKPQARSLPPVCNLRSISSPMQIVSLPQAPARRRPIA